MRPLKFFRVVLITNSTLAAYANAQNREAKQDTMNQTPVVVFVCEHGSAKSVVAAAHFNKLASESNLKLRALARGTNPDKEIAPSAAKGLQADSLAFEPLPRKLTREDVAAAARVVTFCKLPAEYDKIARVETWHGVPPVSEDYNKAREAIVERIKHLLDKLKPAK